jgi:S-adenosylmethionine:tRNA ribosyltransferase-isomerase
VPVSLDDYDFDLPDSSIAQHPAQERTAARLLVWRAGGSFEHRRFGELIDLLDPRDLLVLNDTRVFAARLFGRKADTGAEVEALLVRPADDGWEAMVRPGRRLPPGTEVEFDGGVRAVVGTSLGEGLRILHFADAVDVLDHCARRGHVPLPPYIRRVDEVSDRERYQTVFAREEGSVAAPTAGLHFDRRLLEAIGERGIQTARVTLHVGPGTFRPVEETQLRGQRLHPEWREVPEDTIAAIHSCRARSGRVVAIGTTVCRALESMPEDAVEPVAGPTDLMIAPGHRFRFTDVLVTNFHLPRSSLLLLVSAFAGDQWRDAYSIALREGYRFYSYGDANWIEASR